MFDDIENFKIDDYEFICTCSACPEQYDVFKDGVQVAYLRLRHGRFTVSAPDWSGENIYIANPDGDGCFTPNERDTYINNALEAIKLHYAK